MHTVNDVGCAQLELCRQLLQRHSLAGLDVLDELRQQALAILLVVTLAC